MYTPQRRPPKACSPFSFSSVLHPQILMPPLLRHATHSEIGHTHLVQDSQKRMSVTLPIPRLYRNPASVPSGLLLDHHHPENRSKATISFLPSCMRRLLLCDNRSCPLPPLQVVRGDPFCSWHWPPSMAHGSWSAVFTMNSSWIQVHAACQLLAWVMGKFVDYQLYKVWKIFQPCLNLINLVYQRNLLSSSRGQGTVAKVVDMEVIIVSCFHDPHHL